MKFKSAKAAIDNLPKSLRIGPLDWRIERWAPIAATASKRYGECSHLEQVIRVDSAIVSQHKVADTLLHEISHAIYVQYGIMDDDKEERIVGTFSTGWLQVYRDNPSLLTWLSRCC